MDLDSNFQMIFGRDSLMNFRKSSLMNVQEEPQKQKHIHTGFSGGTRNFQWRYKYPSWRNFRKFTLKKVKRHLQKSYGEFLLELLEEILE